MDQVTHQNARLVQEATTASHTLDDRAGDMHALVGRFRVSDHAGQPQLTLPPQKEVSL
ncbi:hypothetical protein HORIV_48320 [Vreelandella olivaria]|uniref:Methyl-accepting chemotaxis protein n=1 Tax=Vreelandella olivaria TaxID=390919 RepID=A0ABN5X6J0_9GAMM|nr:hypothetical protein HORIV_48320 [Halomonas olivaria]